MPYGTTIVCGIDESPASVEACKQAAALPGTRRSIHAIAVQPPVPMSYEQSAEAMDALDKDMAGRRKLFNDNLEELTNACSEEYAVQTVIEEEGLPHERIVDLAQGVNADLIVLGGKTGSGKVPHRLVGTVVSRVIGYASADVLLVPEGVKMQPGRLLVSVDGSKYCERAIERGLAIASEFKLPIDFVSVADVPDGVGDYPLNQLSVDRLEGRALAVAEKAAERAKAMDVETSVNVVTGSPADRIVDVAKKLGSSLVLMGSHGRTGLRRLLMGSVTERVLQLSPCPVLVTRS